MIINHTGNINFTVKDLKRVDLQIAGSILNEALSFAMQLPYYAFMA